MSELMDVPAGEWDDLLGFDPDEPFFCPRCGVRVGEYGNFHSAVEGSCWAGFCLVVACPGCGVELVSMGPVGCPHSLRLRSPRLDRIRRLYGRRRR